MTRLVPFRGDEVDIRLKFETEEGGTWVEEWDFEQKPEPPATEDECSAINKWIDVNLTDLISDYWSQD